MGNHDKRKNNYIEKFCLFRIYGIYLGNQKLIIMTKKELQRANDVNESIEQLKDFLKNCTNTNADVTMSSGGENKPLLAAGLRFQVPKLTKEQNRILEKIINGAEIQIDWENEQFVYTLCEGSGDSSTVRRDTFERLKESGLIKLKWKPSIDVERWG